MQRRLHSHRTEGTDLCQWRILGARGWCLLHSQRSARRQGKRRFSTVEMSSVPDEVCTIDDSVSNGQHAPKQQVYYPDQQVRVECTPGYELDRLSPVQTCLKNGTWSPAETPKCLRRFPSTMFDQKSNIDAFVGSPCGEPPSIPNAYLINTTSTYARYSCFERYIFKDVAISKIECQHGRWQIARPQCIEATCQHPNVEGFNGYVLNSRTTYLSGEGTGLTCNSSTRFDLIPLVDYLVCDHLGQWKPTLPKCHGNSFVLVQSFRTDTNRHTLEKCRLPDLGKHLIGYYMDDNTNEWYGKELQPGAYIRHGYSIKYQCQCPAKFHQNCSFIQPILTQCADGHWTNGGPHCREGTNALFCLSTRLFFFRSKKSPANAPFHPTFPISYRLTILNRMSSWTKENYSITNVSMAMLVWAMSPAFKDISPHNHSVNRVTIAGPSPSCSSMILFFRKLYDPSVLD